MAAVPPEERAAASSVTNVPRSLAAAITPLLAGVMLSRSSFGWPLICGGPIKAAYDAILYVQFRKVGPQAGPTPLSAAPARRRRDTLPQHSFRIPL